MGSCVAERGSVVELGRDNREGGFQAQANNALRIDTASLSPELELFLSTSHGAMWPALGMRGVVRVQIGLLVGARLQASPRSNPALGAGRDPRSGRRSSGSSETPLSRPVRSGRYRCLRCCFCHALWPSNMEMRWHRPILPRFRISRLPSCRSRYERERR